jgi:HEAT repeat protein
MRKLFYYSAALALCAAAGADAQGSVAERVAGVRDGVVRLQYDSRPGVCGDGKSMVNYRSAMFARDFSGFGRMNDRRCVTGPIRVSLLMAGGRVTQAQTQVGGTWPSLGSPVTDLGVVPAADAAAYFFAHVGEMEAVSTRDRLLLPAVLADADVMAPLLAVARSDKHAIRTRRQAIQWLGLLGDARTVPTLVSFTKGAPDNADDSRDGESLAGTATSALSMLDDGAGIPALMQLARNGSTSVRKNAVFWLAQNGDARGLKVIHAVIEDTKEDERVRKHAIFSLGNNDEVPAAETEYLRSMFGRLDSDALKESVLQAMANGHAENGAWLLARAKDSRESLKVRKSALFWAGQRETTSTADLVTAYHGMDDRALQDQAIFVISQRDDDAAFNALVKIARDDPDSKMRSKALFWLAQKHDPRATKLIGELVLK